MTRRSNRHRGLGLAAITALALLAGPAQAQGAGPGQPPAPARPAVPVEVALQGLDQHVEETLRKWNVPGVAISIVKDGKVVLAKGYGVRDPATGKPMTKDTLLPIGSITKNFTSFDVGLLVDEGKLSFDEPVVSYLNGLAFQDPAANAITLRDMLSHRTGMPRHDGVWYRNGELTHEELVRRMPSLEFTAPIRTRWQYNNLMYALSGLLIERASGKAWETFTKERIFEPLGMKRTTTSWARAIADPDHMGGQELAHGKPVRVEMFEFASTINPAGGIYSTADDMTRWMLLHLGGGKIDGNQLIRPATVADMHRSHFPMNGGNPADPEILPTGYGLGWFTHVYRGRRLVSHGGNITGVSTMTALIPSEQLGVTVLVNQGVSELRDTLAREILDRFLGTPDKGWSAEALARKSSAQMGQATGQHESAPVRVRGTKPSRALADYVGDYVDPGYGRVTVRMKGNRLFATFNDDGAPLDHWHYDVFTASTDSLVSALNHSQLHFVGDLAGRIAVLEMALEPSAKPVRFRKQPDAKLSNAAYPNGTAGT